VSDNDLGTTPTAPNFEPVTVPDDAETYEIPALSIEHVKGLVALRDKAVTAVLQVFHDLPGDTVEVHHWLVVLTETQKALDYAIPTESNDDYVQQMIATFSDSFADLVASDRADAMREIDTGEISTPEEDPSD